MRISHRGLYALKALIHPGRVLRPWPREDPRDRGRRRPCPKFLEGILVTLKNARLVARPAGPRGAAIASAAPEGDPRRRSVRIIDGPVAPFGDAVERPIA
jgi:hypothetical protein